MFLSNWNTVKCAFSIPGDSFAFTGREREMELKDIISIHLAPVCAVSRTHLSSDFPCGTTCSKDVADRYNQYLLGWILTDKYIHTYIHTILVLNFSPKDWTKARTCFLWHLYDHFTYSSPFNNGTDVNGPWVSMIHKSTAPYCLLPAFLLELSKQLILSPFPRKASSRQMRKLRLTDRAIGF